MKTGKTDYTLGHYTTMKKIKAYINTYKGTTSVMIDAVDVKMTAAQIEKMERKFNKEVKVLEYIGGTTYYFHKNKSLYTVKSSSLEELYEMFKAHYNGLPIPERKCFFVQKK